MQQYEYYSWDASHANGTAHMRQAGDKLNQLAREGWRLVSVVFIPVTDYLGDIEHSASRMRYFMERPLQAATAFRG